MKFLSLFFRWARWAKWAPREKQGVFPGPPTNCEVGQVGPTPAAQTNPCPLGPLGPLEENQVGTEKALEIQVVPTWPTWPTPKLEVGENSPKTFARAYTPEYWEKAYWVRDAIAYRHSVCPRYWKGCATCSDSTLSKLDFCKRYPAPKVEVLQ